MPIDYDYGYYDSDYDDLDEDDREGDYYERWWGGPDDDEYEDYYEEQDYYKEYEYCYEEDDDAWENFEPLAPQPPASQLIQQKSPGLSREIRAIFQKHVNEPVYKDTRTKRENDELKYPLGYPKDIICKGVVGRGLTDFSQSFRNTKYGELAPTDKVLLYCYFNMKGHFNTVSEVFIRHQTQLEALFSPDGQTRFLDVGCGPGTACLALADLLRDRTFRYIGIDSAAPMRDKALQLWEAAAKDKLISNGSTASFARSWDDIRLDKLQTDARVFLAFSYFFASRSLTVKTIQSLVRFVRALQDSPRVTAIVMAYINSSKPTANDKYGLFKKLMRLESKAVELNPGTEYEVIQVKGASV
jgi:SAM-dependent methyltransferase